MLAYNLDIYHNLLYHNSIKLLRGNDEKIK